MDTPEYDTGSADIYSVTRLNREVRAVLEGSFHSLWVKGEISNLAIPASGHMYFSLKDEFSQVRCAMFKNRNRLLKFKPENGDEILVQANVSLYEGRGEFQLIVQDMEPAGLGALQKAFEQLKEKLAQEGLFNEASKKSIPEFPQTIGVITSPTGAAIRDILTTLKRRYPIADVIIYPVPVQGISAAGEIARMIAIANNRDENDVLILARGGGSLEDLWSFNEEIVARAIFASDIPIVTGIGHEIDFTIADFVADLRAPTPTSAAEHVSADIQQLARLPLQTIQSLQRTLVNHLQNLKLKIEQLQRRLPHPECILNDCAQSLDYLSRLIFQSHIHTINQYQLYLYRIHTRLSACNPVKNIQHWKERIGTNKVNLTRSMRMNLEKSGNRLTAMIRALETVSPLATLKRGYSITQLAGSQEIVRSIQQINKGDRVRTRLGEGTLDCLIEMISYDGDKQES